MRIAFLVTNYWTFGELLIAKQFADSLRNGEEVFFIIPWVHRKTIESAGYPFVCLVPDSRKWNQIIFTDVVNEFQPDLLILSDFINFHLTANDYQLRLEDLDIFACKIATFDIYDWNTKRRGVDSYGFRSFMQNIGKLDEGVARIQPSPIISPDKPYREGEYRYSIVSKKVPQTKEERISIRKKLGIPQEDKVILISFAAWQDKYLKNENTQTFVELCITLYEKLILSLSKKNIIICVGHTSEVLQGQKNIMVVPSCVPERFQEYVQIADLYLGKNMSSTSMIQIATSGIPCVNIINSYGSNQKVEQHVFEGFDYEERLRQSKFYKYLMFPLGWYYFMSPIFTDNPYGELIQCMEQFEMDETRAKIEELLVSEDARRKIEDKRISLLHSLEKLDDPSTIVERIVRGR